MTIHSWPLQISAISVASYFHVYTCFIAKVFLHGLNFSNCILGRFRYQLWVIPCQINKEFRVTSRILTKFGVFVVPVVLITHANF